MADLIEVEVTYALPERQVIRTVAVPAGTTAMEALERSGIRDEFPGMEVNPAAIGVFSRKVDADYVMRPGDRLEIYRPLIADPKETRRRRARAGK